MSCTRLYFYMYTLFVCLIYKKSWVFFLEAYINTSVYKFLFHNVFEDYHTNCSYDMYKSFDLIFLVNSMIIRYAEK